MTGFLPTPDQAVEYWREAPCPLAVLELNGVIALANRAMAGLLGVAAENLRGAQLQSFLDASSRGDLEAALASEPANREWRRRLTIEAAGQPRDIELSGRVAPDGRILISAVDRQARAAGAPGPIGDSAGTRLVGNIVSASRDGICSISRDGRIMAWNPGAERLYGYSNAEAVGQTIALIVPAERLSESEKLQAAVINGGNATFETIRRHKDGTPVDVSISAGPIFDDAGKIVGVFTVHRDIREHIRREAQLRLVMRELAHRTKNLLAIIQSIERQTARRSLTKEEFHERFSSRLQALAASHDLLVETNWDGALLSDLIERQLAAFSDQIGARILAKGPPLRLSPEVAQTLGLAIHELATNATKYGALATPNGKIEINWELSADATGTEMFHLGWREEGGPPVQPPAQRGFGSLAIERLAAQALNGQAELRYLPQGVQWTLTCDPRQIGPGMS